MTSFPRKGNEAQAVTSSGADAAPIPKGKNPSRTGPTPTHPAVPPSCGGPPSAKAVPTGDPGSSAQRARLTLLPAAPKQTGTAKEENSLQTSPCHRAAASHTRFHRFSLFHLGPIRDPMEDLRQSDSCTRAPRCGRFWTGDFRLKGGACWIQKQTSQARGETFYSTILVPLMCCTRLFSSVQRIHLSWPQPTFTLSKTKRP